MKSHARVVIVGGGVMGVGLLYHLALEGWTDIVLIEKGELTSGSTWHAAGQCPHFNGSLNMTKVHVYGTQLYSQLEALTGHAVSWHGCGGLRLATTDDTIAESSETFTLSANVVGGGTSNASAVGTATLTDNDAIPAISINDVTVNEGAGTATFTVTLSNPSASTVTVNYATSGGTATAGVDYGQASGTLTFAPGTTTQAVAVSVSGDAIVMLAAINGATAAVSMSLIVQVPPAPTVVV